MRLITLGAWATQCRMPVWHCIYRQDPNLSNLERFLLGPHAARSKVRYCTCACATTADWVLCVRCAQFGTRPDQASTVLTTGPGWLDTTAKS